MSRRKEKTFPTFLKKLILFILILVVVYLAFWEIPSEERKVEKEIELKVKS